jgi:hypothetical protein
VFKGFVMRLWVVPLAMGMLAGCGNTAVSHGHNTALDNVDLSTMTDRMARSLAGSTRVNEEINARGKLVVVMQPVENHLTGEILPAGQGELFMARVRSLLAKHAPDKFVWVMNRDAFYRLQHSERDMDLGPIPDRIQPEYALTATFSSLADEDSKHRTAAYLCVYQLTSIATGALVWTDRYEVKKIVVKGFLD